MLIGFDASRAFVDEATGTENYSLNLLRALANVDRKNRYRVYLRSGSQFTLRFRSGQAVHSSQRKKKSVNHEPTTDNFKWPSNFEFKVIRPYRFWTQIGLAWETWKNPIDLLFVPAHTLPILRRRKIGNWLNDYGNEARNVRGLRFTSPLNETGIITSNRPTKYVVTIHDLGVEYLPLYHRFPQRYYLDLASKYAAGVADAIIAVSEATGADLIKRYKVDPKKVFVVSEGVDTRFFKPQSEVPAKGGSASGGKVKSVRSKYKINGDYILFVGTVQPRKNLEMLIKAFSLLVNRLELVGNEARIVRRNTLNVIFNRNGHRDRNRLTLNLVIAGKLGWDYQKILDAPKKYGVEDRIKFLGYVDRVDLPVLYTGANVFAFPSLFEGFGLPILEALSCGCPVVASDIPPHRDILRKLRESDWSETQKFRNLVKSDFRIGRHSEYSEFSDKTEAMILVKPKDVKGWSQFLYQSISQYALRRSFITKRRELASKFSWNEAAKKTLKIFEKVLG